MSKVELHGDATAGRDEKYHCNARAPPASLCVQLPASPEQFPARVLGHHAYCHIGISRTYSAKHPVPLLLWLGCHRQAFVFLAALRLRPDPFTLVLHLWAPAWPLCA